jgi:large-conductance mechanosensitive channel
MYKMSSLLLTLSIAIFVGGALKDFFQSITRDLVAPLLSVFFPDTQSSVSGLTLQVGPVKLLVGDAIAATVTIGFAMLVVTFTLPYIKAYAPLKGAARA